MIFRKKEAQQRVFFATDIHGSETCWRKFLNAGKHYEASVMVLGGDMTGKALVPVVDRGGGRWDSTLLDNKHEMNGEEEVAAFEDAVRRRGYYPFRTDPDELDELEADEGRRHDLFHQHMLATVERWMVLADERLADTDALCYVCPGNDDQFEVDEIVAQAKRVELGEGRVVEFAGYQMASTGWANRTPWDTYREEDEPELGARIEKMVSEVTAPPELTADMRPKYAGRSSVPVGSTAVREAIEKGQPALSLHGHIHEAKGSTRIGRTLAINPGSSYEQGQLLGAVVELDGGKSVKHFVLTSG
jgi:Icc-related predicted phosphoesterase